MRVLVALRRSWVLAVVVFAIVMVATALFAAFAPRAYTATAIVALVPKPDSNPSGDLVQLAVPTYAELADAPSVMTQMADQYGVDKKELTSGVSGDVIPSTNTVLVTVRWDDPDKAAELANGVTAQLEAFSKQDPLLSAYVAAPAEAPWEPSFPPQGLTWAGGAIVAVLAALAAALLRLTLTQPNGAGRSAKHQRRRTELSD
ncbi:Wzz/FepE/Etk N-terminal domain-containing protein [Brevibacterium casei]|uniref:Wzz/FepE/Etk N-terminal domain-containing protein n=1 Tax=Brevibacterium casei TaxID=33889 RepID=UPI0021AEBECA|nr:Wzz/FepE/Etk N-terminal domain-containing protein [Brevibacterium casei]